MEFMFHAQACKNATEHAMVCNLHWASEEEKEGDENGLSHGHIEINEG